MTKCLYVTFLFLMVGLTDLSVAQPAAPVPESLSSRVFRYLDTTNGDEADRLLRKIQLHPEASIERVTRMIQTERIYDTQPIGTLSDERVHSQGRVYPLALSSAF